ncbi:MULTISPECIES: nucleoside hydrolase [Tatumella]|uniref:Nucleoside hydrolase n=1 Tax=Tatumella punctata TaxID=399969 RepID=A0ABW1VHF2_9GAMM|nr:MULTISPECIES: nucleoside hydrolase [unclassified Tatumella]MBS0855455.1 nucleoside hydrolase [Tatumella sp. JGM16]MBS0877173.1 nucleoside hydrolase [Tatumella sp. JGM82]MBS0889458.1 nucleoside hydrolase [Tatumella sp. JGM94]MBS0901570.1 nucleoside hydrolase [Tatumella sp. JGM100]MBS0911689.1 nucleoside hydrolase [Tatumella sp. JGM91]
MQPLKLFFDCDTGIDDALALGYLLAEKEKVEIVGIGSVCGNTDAASGARNTLNLLSLAGAEGIPVAQGNAGHLCAAFHNSSQHIHGENGIGDVILADSPHPLAAGSAAELLVDLARKYPGELQVLATGPLTNLACALQLEPGLGQLLGQVTLMGGAANAPGNRTPVAEANIAEDPEAAGIVFSALDNLVMVPLDVTMQQLFEEHHHRQLLNAERPFARALGEMLTLYMGFYQQKLGRNVCAIHDPAAAFFAVQGLEGCVAPKVKVVIDDTRGPGRGQTICDLRGQYSGFPPQENANCRVVLNTDKDLAPLLIEKLLNV